MTPTVKNIGVHEVFSAITHPQQTFGIEAGFFLAESNFDPEIKDQEEKGLSVLELLKPD